MNNLFITRKLAVEIIDSSKYYHVITITGPRQSGKTTLCRELFPDLPYANLENMETLKAIEQDPVKFIASHPDGVIIDEAHHFPQIFTYIQVAVDEDIYKGRTNRKFIVTGSSNFTLLENVTQSLAGRTAVLNLLPLSLQELSEEERNQSTDTLIMNGGYPSIWSKKLPREKLFRDYYTTYIERDVRKIVNIKDLRQFQTFLGLCAGRIGTEFNASALSNEVGVTKITINNWVNILAASYILYLLPPYFENIGKRLIKSPKVFFYDTGLATYILGIENETQLSKHPLRGQLFENMVINEMMKERINLGKEPKLYFYRDHAQREIDVIRMKAQHLEAYEIKSAMSYNRDFTKHLTFFKELLPDRVTRSAVIYDGENFIDSPLDGVYNYRNFRLDE